MIASSLLAFVFFNDTATTEIYTLSLHDALPISGLAEFREIDLVRVRGSGCRHHPQRPHDSQRPLDPEVAGIERADRKSTRLNSSHANISYAVFCLKKKRNLTFLTCGAMFVIFSK